MILNFNPIRPSVLALASFSASSQSRRRISLVQLYSVRSNRAPLSVSLSLPLPFHLDDFNESPPLHGKGVRDVAAADARLARPALSAA